MTTSILPDYFFITAIPTPTWGQVLHRCRFSSFRDEQLSLYQFEASTGLTLEVRPFYEGWDFQSPKPSGTFFSERYHQHTFMDIIDAVREGTLDGKVLTYPELLSGEDSMVVYFWPDEAAIGQGEGIHGVQLLRNAFDLFEKLLSDSVEKK
ncbi:MAG: hypothetical protein MRJ96_09630 [Nitrospirales bacterium]|nr:hypothetical protein [Nitrospira sp.]MDR4501695.1 hypothetical protein [Nitrospirales bacterium]